MKQATTDTINDEIEMLVNMGVMFTAYDVTKTIRNADCHVLHNDVKQAIEQFDLPDSYKRSSVSVKGARAYVYHPDTQNPNTYNPDSISETVKVVAQKPIAAPTATPTAHWVHKTAQPIPSVTSVRSTTVVPNANKLDKRGRFHVKGDFVRAMGLKPGDTARIDVQNGMIGIYQELYAPSTAKISYTVDEWNIIRISNIHFQKAFGNNPNHIVSVVNPTSSMILIK